MERKNNTCTLFDFMVRETQKYLYNIVSEYLNNFLTDGEYFALYNMIAMESAPDTPLLSSVDDIYTDANDQDMVICHIVWNIRDERFAPILNLI